MDMVTLAAAKKYTKETAQGMGALVGPQGPPGPDGAQGPQGDPGPAGEAGFSPTVAVQNITGGHQVKITDKNGPKVFDVMDGKDGAGSNLHISAGDGITITEKDSQTKIGVTTPVRGIFSQTEFDHLPEEQRNKGLYLISDGDSNSSGGNFLNIYSTQEVRIGTWIDGKPLYRKTYHAEMKTESGGYKYFTLDSSFFSQICKAEGVFIPSGWKAGYALPYVEVSGSEIVHTYSIGFSFEDENHALWLGYSTKYPTIGQLYVSVEYIKTAEEALNV